MLGLCEQQRDAGRRGIVPCLEYHAVWRPQRDHQSVILELDFTQWHSHEGSVKMLPSLMAQHRVVVFRRVPAHPRYQLLMASALGSVVGKERDWTNRHYLPELRMESEERVNPYNQIWHCDTSWAAQPAQYTMLYALEAVTGCATTELGDVAAGNASLSEPRKSQIDSWKAFHHVLQARQTRFADVEPIAAQPVKRSGRFQALQRRLNDGVSVRATKLEAIEPPGMLHPVVCTDVPTGSRHLFLGEHAWCLEHLDEEQSASALNALTADCVGTVLVHQWQPADLMIFNNRTFLHRRGAGGAGVRTLRRSLVL